MNDYNVDIMEVDHFPAPGDLIMFEREGGRGLYILGILLSIEKDPRPLHESINSPNGHIVFSLLELGKVRILRWFQGCGLEIVIIQKNINNFYI